MEKKTIMLILTSAVVGCITINTLALGAYHWVRVYKDWGVTPVAVAQKIDYGHEPEELALNMDTELLKQMEKAVKNELKFRVNK